MLLSNPVKVVLFAPYANIWEHSFPESLVAEALIDRGATVTAVRCGTMLQPHCVAMSAAGVPATAPFATRQRVCVACMKRRDLLDETFPYDSVVLDRLRTDEDHAAARAASQSVTPENWTGYRFDGVALGAYAAYEILLDNKVVGTAIPPEVWPQYLAKLEQSVVTFLAARRVLIDRGIDRVLVYNRLYAVNHAFCAAAESLGIPTYTLQGGGHVVRRAETLTMFRGTESLADVFGTRAWAEYAATPLGAEEIELVREHLDGLLEASSAWAYSSAFEAHQPSALRTRFGVPDNARVLLVPMSSEDEINAARLADVLPAESSHDSLFADQFEWIRYLFEYAEAHPQVHIIVRLHPRMFPNKRESVTSPVVAHILELLEHRPANVALNLPSDDVSLYDLMQIVDVLLNFRSSAGSELAAFGIPVVAPANRDFFTYPEGLHAVGHTREEYARRIDDALATGWTFEQARRAFRWWAFLFSRVAVDLSESVQSRPSAIRPKKPGLRLRLWRAATWIVLQYGPLIRERIALRNRRISPNAEDVFFDVLGNTRGSLAESSAWSPIRSSAAAETRALDDHFARLLAAEWKDVDDDPLSLAGRIRRHLGTRQGTRAS
jgi:hypothetical protein